jgi:zinc protease
MRLLSTALSLCLGVTALAAADKPSKVFPLPYDQHDLPNGLRVVTIPTDYPNVVALFIVVQTGSRNEIEPGKSGFAHFFEHMMFRGTKQYPPAKYQAVLNQAGAASNAFTSDDLTAYHTTFSKEDLEKILAMEADRFQHLEYGEPEFRTEALAVLGEYNKNSASPIRKIDELLHDTAFDVHTYKHTTMGFLKDIQDMSNQYEYSKQFFNRYYRPEYTTVIVTGDVQPKQVRPLVEKYWGKWERGTWRAPIPPEPPQKAARSAHLDWPSPTLPWVAIGYKGAAYSDTEKDQAALDLISFIGFSENSDLYQRLVVDQQKVDELEVDNSDHVDPNLFTVYARIKQQSDMKDVEEQVLTTINGFKDTLVPAAKLDAAKKRLRYQFALGMNNSEAIARIVASYVALRRTPETINGVYDLYASLTPEDLRNVARKYFTESSRTIVTLTGPKQAGGDR